jgi:sugar-phosphatase
MTVVGVGPRAAVHRPDVAVPDLTRVRAEATADGRIRLRLG